MAREDQLPYLDGNTRKYGYYLNHEQQQDGMSLGQKFLLGTAAAIGLAAVGYRTGAIHQLARYYNVHGRAAIKATKQMIDENPDLIRGTIRSLINPDQRKSLYTIDSLTGKRSFSPIHQFRRLQRQYAREREEQMNQNRHREFDVTRLIKQYHAITRSQIPEAFEDALRFHHIRTSLENTGKYQADQIRKTILALEQGRLNYLKSHGDRYITHLLEKGGIQEKDLISDVLHANLESKRIDFTNMPDKDRYVRSFNQKFENIIVNELNDYMKQKPTFENYFVGHRHATIDDVMKLNEKNKFHLDADIKVELKNLVQKNPALKEAVFDSYLYINTKNNQPHQVMDFEPVYAMKRSFGDFLASTNVGALFHLRDFVQNREIKNVSPIHFIPRQSVQPMLNDMQGILPNETMHRPAIFFNGNVYSLLQDEVLDPNSPLSKINTRKMYLGSAKFGTSAKLIQHLAGVRTSPPSENPILRFFDIGAQDKDAPGQGYWSIVSKFNNPNYEPNLMYAKPKTSELSAADVYKMENFFKKNTPSWSGRMLNQFIMHPDTVSGDIRLALTHDPISGQKRKSSWLLSEDEDVISLFEYLGSRKDASVNIRSELKRYQMDPDLYLYQKIPIGESNFISGSYTRVREGIDLIRENIGLELIRNTEMNAVNSNLDPLHAADVAKQLIEAGKINKDDLQNYYDTILHRLFERSSSFMQKNEQMAIDSVSQLYNSNNRISDFYTTHLKDMLKRTNSPFERFSETRIMNQLNDEFVLIPQSLPNGFSNAFQSQNGLIDFAKQFNPTIGRRNMKDVTTASLYSMLIPFRLQDALGNFIVPLGLSDASISSSLNLWGSLLTKRFLPLYLGYEYLGYFNDKTEDLFGNSIGDMMMRDVMFEEMGAAKAREQFGVVDELKKKRQLFHGLDHFAETPTLTLTGVGHISGGGMAASIFGTLFAGDPNIPLREEDTYDSEEMRDYLLYGTDPVRKGRWWSFGSKSAYRGDRIEYFKPNAYRMALNDWEFTNVTATFDEHYGHSPYPTFENPLGFLSNLYKDPYWFEHKHYYDRPYMLSSQLFNPNTMFFGDIGNMTIGQILKPQKIMHPEYWNLSDDDRVAMQQQAIVEDQRPVSPVSTTFMSTGRIKQEVPALPSDYDAPEGFEAPFQPRPIGMFSPQVFGELGTMASRSVYELEQHAYDVISPLAIKSRVSYLDMTPPDALDLYIPVSYRGTPADPMVLTTSQNANPMSGSYGEGYLMTQPRAIMIPRNGGKDQVTFSKIADVYNPTSTIWKAQEMLENFTEPLGIYKWIFQDELLEYNPYKNKMVIESADRATSLSNTFWEQSLGSLGGSLSEIGRRFIRRDDGELKFYNPIPNQMPDWMPGANYYINFKQGDPYGLVPQGEYRLPGEAYEKMNELHPDETGMYGSFDKFKILADVAPWSDEYKFWKDYVEEYIEDPELRKQAAQIKRDVAKRKRKYEFFDYRFKGQDLDYENVTVTKMLDDYTFMTEEFPDPIRIAGVDVHSRADDVLSRYFKPGDTIRIGIDADPSKQVSEDTYGTIRAVVLKGMFNINQDIINRGLMKENMKDFSSAGVAARFTGHQQTTGKLWEWFSHLDTPFHTKFLQVRNAVEEYQRDQTFGKYLPNLKVGIAV